MKIDGGLMGDLSEAGRQGARLEALGYNGAVTAETSHDPFFPLLLAAQETQNIELTTSIAVAFSRTPMNLANIGHDLNSFSKGRFILGLGSQIRPHITKRFSMPWSKPAARMREFISAMRAIWAAWHEGQPLQFEGEFYTHSLMTPMFTPAIKPTTMLATRITAKAPTTTRMTMKSRAARPARFVARRAAADDLQDKLREVTDTLSEKWEESDEKPAIVTLGVYGFVGLVAANGTLRAVDSLPLIPDLLELVGILFSGFFVYQNLLYKPDRAALKETVTKTLNKIL